LAQAFLFKPADVFHCACARACACAHTRARSHLCLHTARAPTSRMSSGYPWKRKPPEEPRGVFACPGGPLAPEKPNPHGASQPSAPKPKLQSSPGPIGLDVSGPNGNLDFVVMHGANWKGASAQGAPPAFILVSNAGEGDADGVYKPADRKWMGCDVLQNRYGDCIISREAQTSAKTGQVKYGYVLGKDGRPLYGSRTDKPEPPVKGWKVFQGMEPVPEIKIFKTWSECCQHGAWYFMEEAKNAAKGEHWKVVLLMADRAFDCHTCARPKGRGDQREGGPEWCEQLCELLATRSDALVHIGEYKKALVDACAAVHFVAAFEWTKAVTRGITACLNLGVSEEQAKLLMEDMHRRSDRDFAGVQALEPVVDEWLERARNAQLQRMVLEEELPDDGRIFFKVVDPEDCKLYASTDFKAKTLGQRSFNDLVRGEKVRQNGTWLELHVSETYSDWGGTRRVFAPIFTEGSEDEQEEILERVRQKDKPRPTKWEALGLTVKPLGIKPPTDMEVPQEYALWKDAPKEPGQKDWPYVYKHGLAVSTMLRGAPESVIDSFVRYHWGIGFNHVFLFFDDPQDPGLGIAKELEAMCRDKKVEGVGMSIHLMDSEWWDQAKAKSRFFLRREKSDMYETVCKMHEKHRDVESRQMIVMDLAILQAYDMDIDWFAHIDIDECIYVPKKFDISARRFFGAMERNIACVRLFNHEAVPEKEECQDWFRECTLFQINTAHCHGFTPKREYDQILRRREGRELESAKPNPETEWFRKLMAKIHIRRQAPAWKLDLKLPPVGAGAMPSLDGVDVPPDTKQFVETFFSFFGYNCGKSVVRLDKHFKAPLPYGVNSFLADNGNMLKEYHQACRPGDAVLLHYPNASFSHWKRKYETLGEFAYLKDGQPSCMRTHLASSQVVLNRNQRMQDLFYRTFIMQNEFSELAALAEYGVVQRIESVRNLLEYWDEEHETPEELPGQTKWYGENGIQFGK